MRETRSQCAAWIPEEGVTALPQERRMEMENGVVVVQKQRSMTQGTNGDTATP